jgi:ribosomal protein S18 acetylase RimI-like enzyme
MKIDGAYEAKRAELVLGEALDLWMVGVSPCTQFARRGIASTLFRLSPEVGRRRNSSAA